MPLYRLPDPGTVRVVNATASAVASAAATASAEAEASRRELEEIHVLLEARLPPSEVTEEGQDESTYEGQGE